jgi:hypothetical protein
VIRDRVINGAVREERDRDDLRLYQFLRNIENIQGPTVGRGSIG